jgi:hypothetical protein
LGRESLSRRSKPAHPFNAGKKILSTSPFACVRGRNWSKHGVTSCAFPHNEYIPFTKGQTCLLHIPLHEYACTVLNPVHARDPLHESYPATRQQITTRLRTHAPVHKIETCLPLLSLAHRFIPLVIVRALLKWKKAFYFYIKKPNS